MARCQRDELVTPAEQKRIGTDEQRADPLLDEGCERRVVSTSLLAFRICNCSPSVRAASCTSLTWVSASG